ncbi:MAG: hypothetical protein O2816_10520 [Planctomycetota bacterium]|nr:hypothetical protein [Planctomycetota bacterium]
MRALCFGAALLFAVDRGAAQTVEPTDPSSVCVRLLRDSRVPQGRAVGFFEAGLAEVAPDSVPTLVRILVERSVPGLDDGEQPQTLSGPQLELIMQALAGADPAVLLAEIPALVVQEESTPEQRAAAVRLVALAGDSDQLVQVLNLTANPDEVRYGSALHAALDWSLLRCLQQAPNQTQRALKARVGLLVDHQAVACARALAEAGSPVGLEVLLPIARRFPGVRTEVLAHARRLGSSGRADLDQEWAEFLIGFLHADEGNLARAAALTLGSFDHPSGVGALVAGLGSSVLASESHWALQRLTGLRMPLDPARWNRWFAGEERFFHADYDQNRNALHGRDAARAVAAIRELSRHRYRRHEIARELALALRDAPSERRRMLCNALEAVGSLEGSAALIDALEDTDPTTSSAAYRALRTITGFDLPADAAAWRARLDGVRL